MLDLEVQRASVCLQLPADDEFLRWASAAAPDAELLIRIVDREESAQLNERYRGKHGATNVLSFPFVVPQGVATELLGDLVICAPVVLDEATTQGKPAEAHWAHLTVHGVLHLQGFDHQSQAEADVMEAEEIAILSRLGYANPYEDASSA